MASREEGEALIASTGLHYTWCGSAREHGFTKACQSHRNCGHKIRVSFRGGSWVVDMRGRHSEAACQPVVRGIPEALLARIDEQLKAHVPPREIFASIDKRWEAAW